MMLLDFKKVSFWLMLIVLGLSASISVCEQLTTLPVVFGFFAVMIVLFDIVDAVNSKLRKNFINSL